MKLDIVLQGPIYSETTEIINNYLSLPFVNNIILSSWHNQPRITSTERVIELYSPNINNPGPGNINRQILSSRRGLELVETTTAIKMRTDQIISIDSMVTMNKFYKENRGKAANAIFVLGMYRNFPFHPRDHVFWGFTEHLKTLFNIPLYTYMESNKPRGSDDYWAEMVRPETWLGVYYYNYLYPWLEKFIDYPEKYLTDKSPNLDVALESSNLYANSVFIPFPRIKMRWPKHGLEEYHYDVGARLSEYWAD